MDALSIMISAGAFIAALAGVVIASRARGDSRRSADAAEAAEHRAARPRLLVEAEGEVQPDATSVIYRVHNLDGPNLVSVVVHRPIVGPADGGGVVYPVAATGGEFGDSAEIGPIPLAGYSRFTFNFGSGDALPEFRVRITCRAATGAPWELSELLTTPRGPLQRMALRDAQERERQERVGADQRALNEARRVSYQLQGGAGHGGSDNFTMTSLHVTVRNDSDSLVTDVHLVVGDSDFTWSPHANVPLSPGEKIHELADLPPGSLPRAALSEASGRPFRSYSSRLEYGVDGRRFQRTEDGLPELLFDT